MIRHSPLSLVLASLLGFLAPGAAHADPASQARGAYLVEVVGACGSCHTPFVDGRPDRSRHLAGGMALRGNGYTAFASNITPDDETGIGRWSSEEIVRALREGKRPDDSTIGVMPFDLYRRISDRDARAIAVYLKSLEPVRNRVPRSTFAPPLPATYGPPLGNVGEVPRDDRVRYGAYLAGPIARCVECHTPSVNGKPDYRDRLGAGGVAFSGPWGETVSGNITPDVNTGLGAFSDGQIEKMIRSGVRPNRSRLGPPMTHDLYSGLEDSDLEAIVAYLRSLKPVGNFIDK